MYVLFNKEADKTLTLLHSPCNVLWVENGPKNKKKYQIKQGLLFALIVKWPYCIEIS